MTIAGWHTTIGASGKAHLYVEHVAVCATAKHATTHPACFTRPTRPTAADDHICRLCAKVEPRTCECWSCRAKREGALR